jgi:long-chain acyl-CoA synthetase
MFISSSKEYVAAEKIENILNQSLLIGQNFVYGDSFQSALVAIIVPDEEAVQKWASDSGDVSLANQDFKSLCKSQSLHSAIMEEIKVLAKKNGLHGFETPRAISFEAEPFSAENGLTTPTFKLKRHQLREHYQSVIDEMYSKMPSPPSKL